jgi:sugar (pentulose or hexulose) kinase
MITPARVAVIDIGKTNAKLALVDTVSRVEIAVATQPNHVRPGPPWPHADLDGLWAFVLDGLKRLHRRHGIDAIVVTTHGASIVLLSDTGGLAAPMLDYEHDGPDRLAEAYNALRPDFEQTGSPRLPGGLNIGAQLHWMFAVDPDLKQRTATILTYPQYWGHRLTGEIASDFCSLGCHTDLWQPKAGAFSSLCDTLDITGKMAPPRAPMETLGTLRPSIAVATGIRQTVPVSVGIHDSNASLLPHLLTSTPPFAVVSTGTWVISLAVGARVDVLDPARDTLINVDAFGNPVPSARFMGGREFDLMRANDDTVIRQEAMQRVLEEGVFLLPSVVPESGPFQGYRHRWINLSGDPAVHNAALGFYLGLMSLEGLALLNHTGPIIVEGPLGRNDAFLEALAGVSGAPVSITDTITGTSIGASLLTGQPSGLTDNRSVLAPKLDTSAVRDYAAAWRSAF